MRFADWGRLNLPTVVIAALCFNAAPALSADCESVRAEAMATIKQPDLAKDLALIAFTTGFPGAAKKNREPVLAAAGRVNAWLDEMEKAADKVEAAGCAVGDVKKVYENAEEMRRSVSEAVKLTEP